MDKQEIYEQLGMCNGGAGLVALLQETEQAYATGDISQEEFEYMISEIRDVKAAEELAGDEVAVRYAYQACNLLLGLV